MNPAAQVVLHSPRLALWHTADGLHFALDTERPSWFATDERGARILGLIDGERSLGEVARLAQLDPQPVKNYQHVETFVQAARRAGLVSEKPFRPEAYRGRAEHLQEWRLRELWLHMNDSCNLRCAHCLVSSGPEGEVGLPAPVFSAAVDQAAELGVERVFFTGGEPFLRQDLFALADHVTRRHSLELVILTNATLAAQERLRASIEGLDRKKVRFQVSLDGADAPENDALRGPGSFERAAAGLRLLSELGFATSLTAVPCRSNLTALPRLPALARSLGASSFHLMWPHRRGRALSMLDDVPSAQELIALARATREAARAAGIRFDNHESALLRANGFPGVKNDLGMAGVESLCLSSDGLLYPSAATANEPALAVGRFDGARPLLEVWRSSEVVRRLQELSLLHSAAAREDPLRFVTGGGDVEHAYTWTGSFSGGDPWAAVTAALVRDAMEELARRGRDRLNRRGLCDAPVVFHAMGEGALACGDEVPGSVRTLHSNCVLAFDVERPRALVQDFYGAAAEKPDEALCCPVRPSADDLSHIPKDVVDRFYGCGSPVAEAALRAGEVAVDLGSGAGIDVFIAAKHVGRTGRAIGVDMTDRMLAVAEENRPIVAANLGYDAAEFRKGFLEKVPVRDEEVDCVTSNCVVNLSPDKRAVFAEIWRVLRQGGRVVLSDIVVDRAVPPHFRVNPHLWGECLSGALSEEELYAELERAGFYGIERLRRSLWRSVEGLEFSSVTVRAYKDRRRALEVRGYRAVYHGPFKGVSDEAGQFFLRGEAVAVSAEAAARLQRPPYAGSFTVLSPEGAGLPGGGEAKPSSCCRG